MSIHTTGRDRSWCEVLPSGRPATHQLIDGPARAMPITSPLLVIPRLVNPTNVLPMRGRQARPTDLPRITTTRRLHVMARMILQGIDVQRPSNAKKNKVTCCGGIPRMELPRHGSNHARNCGRAVSDNRRPKFSPLRWFDLPAAQCDQNWPRWQSSCNPAGVRIGTAAMTVPGLAIDSALCTVFAEARHGLYIAACR